MTYRIMRMITVTLACILFIMPVMSVFVSSLGATAEERQLDPIVVIIMGVYNLPLLAVAVFGIVIGDILYRKKYILVSVVFLLISILASVIGSGLMLTFEG